MREDVSIQEIMALIAGAMGTLDRHGISAKSRERMLAVIFDGLRVQAQSPVIVQAKPKPRR